MPDQSEVPPDRVSSGPQLDDEESARALAANLNAPLLEGSAIDLLLNGDEIFPAMLEAIGQARESINLLTYIYWRGPIARRFADALAEAAQRGVQVRLLVDAIGGDRLSDDIIEQSAPGRVPSSHGSGRCTGTTWVATTIVPIAR